MKITALAAAAVTLLTSGAAFAQSKFTPPTPAVPEIDALAGLAALAVVGGAVALIRERSRH
jgi:hypothetical protein